MQKPIVLDINQFRAKLGKTFYIFFIAFQAIKMKKIIIKATLIDITKVSSTETLYKINSSYEV